MRAGVDKGDVGEVERPKAPLTGEQLAGVGHAPESKLHVTCLSFPLQS